MTPGIHHGLPEEAYFSFDACSNSRLTEMLDSPAQCRFSIDYPTPPTEAMILGSALDCLTFTPEEWPKRYQVFGQCEIHTKSGPRCSNGASKIVARQQVCGVHGKGFPTESTLYPLSQDDWEVIQAMHMALDTHQTARDLLTACEPEFQISLFWDFHGMPCKARLDAAAWDLDGGTIVDLKKT